MFSQLHTHQSNIRPQKKNHVLSLTTQDNSKEGFLFTISIHNLPVANTWEMSLVRHTLHTISEHDKLGNTMNLWQVEGSAPQLCNLSIKRYPMSMHIRWHHHSSTSPSPWTTESWDHRKKNLQLDQPTQDDSMWTLSDVESIHTLPVSTQAKESSAQQRLHTPSEHDLVKKIITSRNQLKTSN